MCVKIEVVRIEVKFLLVFLVLGIIFIYRLYYNLHFVILYSYIHIVYAFYSVFYALSKMLSYTYTHRIFDVILAYILY